MFLGGFLGYLWVFAVEFWEVQGRVLEGKNLYNPIRKFILNLSKPV